MATTAKSGLKMTACIQMKSSNSFDSLAVTLKHQHEIIVFTNFSFIYFLIIKNFLNEIATCKNKRRCLNNEPVIGKKCEPFHYRLICLHLVGNKKKHGSNL
jgi:hypothetical protein